MPIPECDPWREQYFAHIPCPPQVIVPTDDPQCWSLFPQHRWVLNKLLICETQGIEAGPHGVEPREYPVFSKPIVNLRGMGIGSRIVRDAAELQATHTPGHMWMRLLEGEQLSTDAAVIEGVARWWRHTHAAANADGTFDYWTVLAESRPGLEDFLGGWLRSHLAGYTGMVNFETIAGRIIECHLRFSDQWPDLYGGDEWVSAAVELYARGVWRFDDAQRRDGFSVVLWGPHGRQYGAPDAPSLARLRASPGVSSIQITFDPARPQAEHAMPPGGFRLAIVNCWDLEAGRQARKQLHEMLMALAE